MGLIKKWFVTGPFLLDRVKDWLHEFGPEKQSFDSNAKFEGLVEGKSGWSEIQVPDASYNIDQYSHTLKACVYFFTYVNSPDDRDAIIYTGSQDDVRMWLNSVNVLSIKHMRAGIPDVDVTRVHLKKGVNELVTRVCRYMGQSFFECRITDLHGNGMPDVTYSVTNTPAIKYSVFAK